MRYVSLPALCLAGLLPFATAQSATGPKTGEVASAQPALTPQQQALFTRAGE